MYNNDKYNFRPLFRFVAYRVGLRFIAYLV